MEQSYPLKITKPVNVITDKKELLKYVWAFTLGDGCLTVSKNKHRIKNNINYTFDCSQISEHEDYILWRADILSNITGVYIQERQFSNNNTKLQLRTTTGRHPFFTTLRQRMYLNNNKIIDPHDLKLLDWETLAILYQDDGSLSLKDKKYNLHILSLATESFSYGDNILLQRAIKDKTDILFRVQKCIHNGHTLYRLDLSRKDDIKKFVDGVSKFIKPSFEYKINLHA